MSLADKQFLSRIHSINKSNTWEWVPGIPNENYYLYLTEELLDSIIIHRDVVIEGTREEKAIGLYEWDNIDSQWITRVSQTTLQNLSGLIPPQMYAYGALSKVNFAGLINPLVGDVISYIRCYILLKDPATDKFLLQTLLQCLKKNMLCVLGRNILGLDENYLQFYSPEDLQKIVLGEKIVDPVKFQGPHARFVKINSCKHIRLLRRLYRITTDEAWIPVINGPVHPLETIILHLEEFPIYDIVRNCGMVIPEKFAQDPVQYFLDNIISYADIFLRKDTPRLNNVHLADLKMSTDIELFQRSKAYLPYDSRSELVTNTHTFLTNNNRQFFLPLDNFYNNSTNKTTVLGYEFTDEGVVIIGYGNYGSWYGYELTELYQSFYEEEGVILFRKPDNTHSYFTSDEIIALLRVIDVLPASQIRTDITKRIRDGLAQHTDFVMGDIQFKQMFRGFTKETQDIIYKILKEVFHLGMYMRRWKGPGHPFPIHERDTHGPLPDVQVTEQMTVVIPNLLASLTKSEEEFCFGLTTCSYVQGAVTHDGSTLGRTWKRVKQGTYCIRMASTVMIGTAYHYLQLFFGEMLEGLPVKTIEHIA